MRHSHREGEVRGLLAGFESASVSVRPGDWRVPQEVSRSQQDLQGEVPAAADSSLLRPHFPLCWVS